MPAQPAFEDIAAALHQVAVRDRLHLELAEDWAKRVPWWPRDMLPGTATLAEWRDQLAKVEIARDYFRALVPHEGTERQLAGSSFT
jgi:hypothetical protein